jgi:hypothetical protein
VIFFLSFDADLSFNDIAYFNLDGIGNKKDSLFPVRYWAEWHCIKRNSVAEFHTKRPNKSIKNTGFGGLNLELTLETFAV